jgi:hypothetical protein
VYDECQNLQESALTDMLAAMNVSDIGLAFFMGTPPRPQESRSECMSRSSVAATRRSSPRSATVQGCLRGVLPESPTRLWLTSTPGILGQAG